ncbi:T-cell surface glycoprotein CD4-like [Lissotriton helveticus]
MGPLLLFIGVFLTVSRATTSAESRVDARAGHVVKITCPPESEDPVREWRWKPRYPGCVTTGSTEVVIYSPSVHPWWEDGADPFRGRLEVPENKRELTLQNLRVSDSGTFYCVGEDNKSSSVHLSVSHGCDPAPAQGVDQLGKHMRLLCCESQPPVTWLRDGQAVRSTSSFGILRNGVLAIPTLGPEHRGLWSCLDEEGKVLVELCLQVAEEQDAPAPTGGHSTRGAAATPISGFMVWGIAKGLEVLLLILLVTGVYCCRQRQNLRAPERKRKKCQYNDGSSQTHL